MADYGEQTQDCEWPGAVRRDEDGYYVEDKDHIRRLMINRPDRMNALSLGLQDGIIEECLRASRDREVRVFMLAATGSRAFCAGGDVKEMAERDRVGADNNDPMKSTRKLVLEVLLELYKPTIAVVNGLALGAGLELALACDIRFAAPHAKFGLPEAKIGMGAAFGSVVLPKRIPTAFAMQMLFTGEHISAEKAERWGLVNEVVPSDRLMSAAMTMATVIAANAPISVRRMKEMAMKGLDLPVATALRLDVGPSPYVAKDRQEGINAFLEKRRPNWAGE